MVDFFCRYLYISSSVDSSIIVQKSSVKTFFSFTSLSTKSWEPSSAVTAVKSEWQMSHLASPRLLLYSTLACTRMSNFISSQRTLPNFLLWKGQNSRIYFLSLVYPKTTQWKTSSCVMFIDWCWESAAPPCVELRWGRSHTDFVQVHFWL